MHRPIRTGRIPKDSLARGAVVQFLGSSGNFRLIGRMEEKVEADFLAMWERLGETTKHRENFENGNKVRSGSEEKGIRISLTCELSYPIYLG
jgi:hypothetical protein